MLIINTILENITSRKDSTWKLTFGTQELTPDQVKELTLALNNFVFMALKVAKFRTAEMKALENLDVDYEDNKKSQSQRIRAVLFKLWDQDKEGYDDFEMYYRNKTEKYIEHLKTKIV